MKPRDISNTFFPTPGPYRSTTVFLACEIVGNGDTFFSASLKGQNFEYTSMLIDFFVAQVDFSLS